jgi:hypothetical protein
MSENSGLEAGEGVNEGSAQATAEGPGSGGDDGMEARAPGAEGGALAAASGSGHPKGEYDPAPPVDTGLPHTATDGSAAGPGQELDVDS